MYQPPSGGVQDLAGGQRHEGRADAADTRRHGVQHSWVGLREVSSGEVTYQPVHTGAQYTGPCRASVRRINGEVDEEEEAVAKDETLTIISSVVGHIVDFLSLHAK